MIFKEKEHLNSGQSEPDEEDLAQSQNNGMNITKSIQELLSNGNVIIFMNFMNFTNTSTVNLLYLYRTGNMCLFDKNPVWHIPPKILTEKGDITGLWPPELDDY